MLQLSRSFLNRAVMSLRNGRPVAQTTRAIINPNNLKIEGLFCQDSVDRKKELVLLYQDVRDIIPQGLVVDDHDVLSEPADLVRLKDILALNFDLLGMPVETDTKKRLGKVNDFATETATFYIKKLYVSPTLFKSLSGGSMSIDRSQIIEITNRRIIVQDPLQYSKSKSVARAPLPAN